MNPADLLLKLADYFTTLRLAVKAVFVSLGIIFSLLFIFPLLQTWVTLGNYSSNNYAFEIHFTLSSMLGYGLGNIVFHLLDWVLKKIMNAKEKSLESRILAQQSKAEKIKTADANQQFKDKFKLAHSQLYGERLLILNELKRKPRPYHRNSNEIHYLSRQEWIVATVDLSQDMYIYEIDDRISEALDEIRHEEIQVKSTMFIESEKLGCQKVLGCFLTDQNNDEIHPLSKREFLQARRDYDSCFNIQANGNIVTISFLLGFHEYFKCKFGETMPYKITVELRDDI